MSIQESANASSQLAGALADGINLLDLQQEITFQGYSRTVLPIDGYVFWIPSVKLTVKGSLHTSQDIVQNEDEILALSTVMFTALDQVAHFRDAPTNTIYVADWGNFRFAFSSQQGFYGPSQLWHYVGHSIAPAMASQLLDPPRTIDPTQAVTSNSLALWLALNGYQCPYYDGFSNPITLYPSKLTPPNLTPPYGVVHIGDEDTESFQAAPYLTSTRSSYQNCADRVRVTVYGLQAKTASDFYNCVLRYSVDVGTFGIMNMPVVRDSKREQNELEAIAMKKTIEFRVNYNQSTVEAVGRQLILSAVPSIYLATSITDQTYILAQQAPA